MFHFIVNPNARSGLGLSIWKNIEKKLIQDSVTYNMYFTKYPQHATKLASEITAGGEALTLIVLGGDGSVNEVVNGIRHLDKITLGYIPIGSSNDFARGLGLPANPMEALEVVLHSTRTRTINLGLLSYLSETRRFAVSSGIGYDAAICHEVSVSRLKRILNKLRLGKLAYVAVSLHCLYRCKAGAMTVTLNDNKSFSFKKTYFAAAFNLPYEGGGCKFCPNARPDDNLIDLIVIADVPKIQALAILPAVFSGKHTHMKGVHIFRCHTAQIDSVPALPVHSDGEPISPQRSVAFSLENGYINVITT